MELDDYSNILEIFPKEWFENDEKKHPLYILNKKKKYVEKYFENFDYNLAVMKKGKLISKNLKVKLRNHDQFEDTLIEIKVAVYLLENGINVILPSSFPDIIVPEENAIIEVKNIHISEKLSDSNGDYAILVDDIKRIWDKITDEVIDKLNEKNINLILVNAPVGMDFDEFEDLFVFCKRTKGGVNYIFDKKTMQRIFPFNGEFSRKENKIISGVIMMKKDYFKGILNPLNGKEISHKLIDIFNLKRITFN